MDLADRIDRRRAAGGDEGLVTDRLALSPAHHLPEPVDRGPALERLLDVLSPVFDGDLPSDLAVVGPKGSGKSAVVSALFAHLDRQLGRRRAAIGTTTRSAPATGPSAFVYVDARRAASEFALYRALLDAVSDERVPERGVGADVLAERLGERVRSPGEAIVVAVDHVDEPGTLAARRVTSLLAPLGEHVALTVVAAEAPADWTGRRVALDAYRTPTLVDVLSDRASRGLATGSLAHEQARRVAAWADGDAHDALCGLFGAAVLADEDGADRIREADVDAALAAVPDDAVSVERALALPENRRRVLHALLAVAPGEDSTVGETARAVADRLDLTESTVTRFLYELAEVGVLARERLVGDGGDGRRPSRVRPRFPTLAFERLDGSDE